MQATGSIVSHEARHRRAHQTQFSNFKINKSNTVLQDLYRPRNRSGPVQQIGFYFVSRRGAFYQFPLNYCLLSFFPFFRFLFPFQVYFFFLQFFIAFLRHVRRFQKMLMSSNLAHKFKKYWFSNIVLVFKKYFSYSKFVRNVLVQFLTTFQKMFNILKKCPRFALLFTNSPNDGNSRKCSHFQNMFTN